MYKIKKDKSNRKYLETNSSGYNLINNPLLNKGTSFTEEERDTFQLHGIVPCHQFTLEEVIVKCYNTLIAKPNDLEKHIYLRQLQDRNETLFYALIDKHTEEIMPLVYTPVVGLACQSFSHIYRKARGVFVSYPHRDKMDVMLASSYFDNVEVIVVSDGERILGLGDQGCGGMGIPIGKLSLYTACAHIAPDKTLPILLDVGTDNEALLNDPQYIGWRNKRIRGKEYDNFIHCFINAVKRRFPNILLQWEDFAQSNALRLLNTYKDELCSFNDDVQGTAAIVVSGAIAAIKSSTVALQDHRILIVGAGSAGVGISNLIVDYMEFEGIDRNTAYNQIYLVDRYGLITENISSLDFQANFVKNNSHITNWKIADKANISLLETVTNSKATMIIGVCGQSGIFTQDVIEQMAFNSPHPIIFPLSNPTDKAEAKPTNIMQWTNGKALIGTGSPFPPIVRSGKEMRVDQVNNCYIFPGVGLGVLAVKAKLVTNKMFLASAIALAKLSPALNDPEANLLPPLNLVVDVSKHVAVAVAREAINSGLTNLNTSISDEELLIIIEEYMWAPEYLPYKKLG